MLPTLPVLLPVLGSTDGPLIAGSIVIADRTYDGADVCKSYGRTLNFAIPFFQHRMTDWVHIGDSSLPLFTDMDSCNNIDVGKGLSTSWVFGHLIQLPGIRIARVCISHPLQTFAWLDEIDVGLDVSQYCGIMTRLQWRTDV